MILTYNHTSGLTQNFTSWRQDGSSI